MHRRWNSHVHVCYAGFGIRSFAHSFSLFLSSLICSKLLIVKSDREQFAHVALYYRVNRSLLSLKKSDVSDSLLIRFFHMFFTFFTLFMPKRELLPSLFAHSLFLKERLHSRRSLQTSDCERFALVALFHEWLLFRSFAHNKRANCSTNLWENSQPWCYVRGCSVNSYVLTIFRVKFFAFYQVTIL